MSEYWKSTPRYWCKHCKIYVRDTKLERANHEATLKHESAVKRSLGSLHRDHERGERDADRAKREVERLNGIVSGSSRGTTSTSKPWGSRDGVSAENSAVGAAATTDRQRQLSQLAEMGVNIPENLRADMAMAGDWTVTKTRVLQDPETTGNETGGNADSKAAAIRKRELQKTEEELEEEEAVNGLFKKQKRWGRDSRMMPTNEDEELDNLLSSELVRLVEKEEVLAPPTIKEEEENLASGEAPTHQTRPDPLIKHEPGIPTGEMEAISSTGGSGAGPPAVVFKKRRAKKNTQQIIKE